MKKLNSKIHIFILPVVLPLVLNAIMIIDKSRTVIAMIKLDFTVIIGFAVMYCLFRQEYEKEKTLLNQEYERGKLLLEKKNEELEKQIKTLTEQRKTIFNYYKNSDQNANGNNLLYMALTQHPAEPMRISLLKKSVDEYKNPMAAIILASIYRYGVEKDGVLVCKANSDKAYNLYAQFAELDASGLCDWQMGFYYQSRAKKAIKDSNESNDLFIKARECYETSLEKGFPKAKNSLGNLIVDSKAGFDKWKDLSIMLAYYQQGSENGDVYATINSGHYYYDKEYKKKGNIEALNVAKIYYEKARKMGSPQGTLYAGMIELELNRMESDGEHLQRAKDAICSCISYGNNQFSAIAYCLLGNMLSKYSEQMEDTNVKLIVSSTRDDKAYIECYQRAYHIFTDLISRGESISEKSDEYYKLLKNSFENINTEFFNCG